MVATQPAMTSMYMPSATTRVLGGSPSTSVLAPQTSTILAGAAPSYVGQTSIVQAAPSYVAAPAFPTVMEQVVAPVVAPSPVLAAFNMPKPVSLTKGLDDPTKLATQRTAYDNALKAQLDKQCKAAEDEAKVMKQMLQQQYETQLA